MTWSIGIGIDPFSLYVLHSYITFHFISFCVEDSDYFAQALSITMWWGVTSFTET